MHYRIMTTITFKSACENLNAFITAALKDDENVKKYDDFKKQFNV